jgi:hypothetical protein
MMAGYHAKVEPAEQIQNIKGVLHLKRKDGVIVLLAPVDFVVWTKKLEAKMNVFESSLKESKDVTGKELWITGKIDKTARDHFEGRGWKITENANDILLK